MNNRQCYFLYPRDKNGKLTGHSICVMSFDGKIFHGTAICSPNDNFDKKIGRELAKKRAEDNIKKHQERFAINKYISPEKREENIISKVYNYFRG